MANPIFKITNNNSAFYIIYSTYYGLPYTLPCDLTSLVCLLYEKNWLYEGLIACWANLKTNNTSLEDEIISNSLDENTYNLLIAQTEDEFISKKEVDNRRFSGLIHNKLDELSNKYQSNISNNSENELKAMHEEFTEFLKAKIIYNVTLLPLALYQNIDRTYGRIVDHLKDGEYDNFRNFLNTILPERKSAEWFQELLFQQQMNFEDIPLFVRKHYTFNNVKLKENNYKSSFSRCTDVIKIVELELNSHNLIGYFNHLINDEFRFSTEVLKYFQEIGLIKENEKTIPLIQLETALKQNLIDAFLPLKLINFIDKDNGMILPPLYTDCYEHSKLIKMHKYDLGLIDVYSKNGDLIFSNLDDIEIAEKENDIFCFYIDKEGRKIFKKIILAEKGSPIQIQRVNFDVGNEIFKYAIEQPIGDYFEHFQTETEPTENNLPF